MTTFPIYLVGAPDTPLRGFATILEAVRKRGVTEAVSCVWRVGAGFRMARLLDPQQTKLKHVR